MSLSTLEHSWEIGSLGERNERQAWGSGDDPYCPVGNLKACGPYPTCGGNI